MKPVLIASGIYVLRSGAAAIVASNQKSGAADVFRLLKDRKEKIVAFEHNAPWVDVNDKAAVARADRLVASNPVVFERRSFPPDATDKCVLIRRDSQILVSDR